MAESWRWQLRDAEGQWVRMGSRVKWLDRGRTLRGTVVGSPRENVATVKPEGGGPTKDIDVRRITVDTPQGTIGAKEAPMSQAAPRMRIIGYDEDETPTVVRAPSGPLVWTNPMPGTYEAPGFKINSLGRGKWSVTVTDEFGGEEVYTPGFTLKEAKEFSERTHREQVEATVRTSAAVKGQYEFTLVNSPKEKSWRVKDAGRWVGDIKQAFDGTWLAKGPKDYGWTQAGFVRTDAADLLAGHDPLVPEKVVLKNGLYTTLDDRFKIEKSEDMAIGENKDGSTKYGVLWNVGEGGFAHPDNDGYLTLMMARLKIAQIRRREAAKVPTAEPEEIVQVKEVVKTAPMSTKVDVVKQDNKYNVKWTDADGDHSEWFPTAYTANGFAKVVRKSLAAQKAALRILSG